MQGTIQQRRTQGLTLLGSAGSQRKLLESEMMQKAAASIDVPGYILADLEANSQYAKAFFTSIGQAVKGSVEDTEAGVKVVSEALLKERIEMCYDLIIAMRREGHRSFKECFGALSTMLREMIVERRHRDDIVGDRAQTDMAILDGRTLAQASPATAEDFRDE